jgi:hypothetical protein
MSTPFCFLGQRLHVFKYLFAILCWLCAGMVLAAPQGSLHQGPALDVQVQRGDARLPLALVDRLRRGDKVLVRPDVETLAKGDWVLLLARVSPTGNQVESRRFDVRDLEEHAELEIEADNQIPVILLAPQLRSLFGLYTSLSDSASLLEGVLRADPQRFYELQKVDQINQAIQAIGRGLARRVSGHRPEEAIQVARQLAASFGVANPDPECFRNQSVNTECVANDIVASRDFSLPSANDLTAMVGNKSSVDLNSLLAANLRLISQASDYLGSKYRDAYDFAPTFGRRQPQGGRVELFSISRFRSGGIKTAYIYVPAWFMGVAPALSPDERRAGCYNSGRLAVKLKGRLPLAAYWHDWRMTLHDPEKLRPLGDTVAVLDQESGHFSFDPLALDESRRPRGQQVVAIFSGRFGFDAVTLGPVRMALPWQDAETVHAELDGLADLVSGDRARLSLRPSIASACVNEMSLTLADGSWIRSEPDNPAALEVDLGRVVPSSIELRLAQAAAQPLFIRLRVLQPRARIASVEHPDWEDGIIVSGDRLDRIARIEMGSVACALDVLPEQVLSLRQIRLPCQGEVHDNSRLPDQVVVKHRDGEPAAIRVPLSKSAARPRLLLVQDTPSALLVTPSAKAQQWGLAPDDLFMSDDSGLGLLLQAEKPYRIEKGSYRLQLRFRDDPHTDAQPIAVPLIADFAHQELRTRSPLRFRSSDLPGVVNPIEYRVQHQPSGQAGDWRPLGRSVLLLPDLHAMYCSPQRDAWWVSGKNLDLIDGIGMPSQGGSGSQAFLPSSLLACPDGLCLSLPKALPAGPIEMRLRWVDRVFDVRLFPVSAGCSEPVLGSAVPDGG